MTEDVYLKSYEFSTCPNCEEDTRDSEVDGGGHTPDAYYYYCKKCGCRYGVHYEEVQHGLGGWRLEIDSYGDPRKSPEWFGKLEGKWLKLYNSIEDVEECWDNVKD